MTDTIRPTTHPHALLTRRAFEGPLDEIAAADARGIVHAHQLSAYFTSSKHQDKFLITLVRAYVGGKARFLDVAGETTTRKAAR